MFRYIFLACISQPYNKCTRIYCETNVCNRQCLLVTNMLVLFILMFGMVMPLQKYLSHEHYFRPRTTEKERNQLFDMLNLLDDLLMKNNITYFLHAGALLGSYRHHGLIPWDDDMDVFVNASHYLLLGNALHSLEPEFTLNKKREFQWKFHASFNSEDYIQMKKWKWPYIDFFFFTENDTHIWHLDDEKNTKKRLRKGELWPKTEVFPLKLRPFGPRFYPAPCSTGDFLKRKYFDIGQCQTTQFNHKSEKKFKSYLSVNSVACKKLSHFVPLVHRKETQNYTIETLKVGSWVLHTLNIPKCKNTKR